MKSSKIRIKPIHHKQFLQKFAEDKGIQSSVRIAKGALAPYFLFPIVGPEANWGAKRGASCEIVCDFPDSGYNDGPLRLICGPCFSRDSQHSSTQGHWISFSPDDSDMVAYVIKERLRVKAKKLKVSKADRKKFQASQRKLQAIRKRYRAKIMMKRYKAKKGETS